MNNRSFNFLKNAKVASANTYLSIALLQQMGKRGVDFNHDPQQIDRETVQANSMTDLKTRPLQHDRDASDDSFYNADWGAHRPGMLQNLLIGLTRRTFLQRGRMRHRMTNLITGMGRPIDVTFRGCNFRIEGRNNLIEYGLLTRPSYNGMEIDFLAQAVKQGGTALDIGCNIGLYSLPLAKAAGAQGRVVAIDANADMTRHLDFNAKASNLGNITTITTAVGGAEGRADLHIRANDVAIVSVIESDSGTVPVRPLMAILNDAGITSVDALKIDIEGHEDQALVPYLQSAPDAMLPARIVIERPGKDTDYAGCTAEFERLGYKLRGRSKINSLYERDLA